MPLEHAPVRRASRPARPGTETLIIGAGPAGLTAAYALVKHGVRPTVVEADDIVGGIARTVERDGYRFDIGGHRFFTKVDLVNELWREILGEEDWLLRPRLSRIHYRGTTFDYPLRAFNALKGLGLLESARCFASYAWARLRPPKDQTTFDGWVTARFGARLYRIFFKTYTEKVWGVPAHEIQADWAAQRIKNLSLLKAAINAMLPRRNRKDVTSLIEEFHYPRLGPGMMWEEARRKVEAGGGRVLLETPVTAIHRNDDRVIAVTTTQNGRGVRRDVDHVVSSMPLQHLVMAMDPPAPAHVQAAANGLRYRDFLTVALVVPESAGFPDNWIYIHDPDVLVGRIQNFGSWSPEMVRPGRTCLGLEYFLTVGDDLWNTSDAKLVELAKREIGKLGLCDAEAVEAGYVVRMPKAYPFYDKDYKVNVETIRSWLAEHAPNVHPVGRNGMHRYNNQDHSMLTAVLAVENILGAQNDVWEVNVDEEYHEERRTERPAATAPGRWLVDSHTPLADGSAALAPVKPGGA